MTFISRNISAQSGQPSTFWSYDEGKTWYRTKELALQGNAQDQVNPNEYVYKKSFWAQNKKTILVCGAIALILGFGFFLWHKGVITFHVHKS